MEKHEIAISILGIALINIVLSSMLAIVLITFNQDRPLEMIECSSKIVSSSIVIIAMIWSGVILIKRCK